MEINITLQQTGLTAAYAVEEEDNITYNARLKTYTGDRKPPLYIKLYRTELGWKSAFEDEILVRELGGAIDQQEIKLPLEI